MIGRTDTRIASAAMSLLLLGLGALPVLAAEPHAAGEAAQRSHGSPPLFSVDPGLMIWTIITFVLVLAVLRATAWKPLLEMLKEREKSIEGAIGEAQKIKTEAEELLARHRSLMNRAKDDARGILDEARRDGLALREEIRGQAQKEAEEFKQRARREIELAKSGALREIWEQAAALSTELASRILGRALDADDQERLVRELTEEMREELNGREVADRAGAGAGSGSESA